MTTTMGTVMASSHLPGPLERRAQTFSGRSVAVLRDMVLSGLLSPGQRLNEVELARALEISRGPLREAIQRLASEGLLTIVSHRGAYVRTFDAGELRDLYELRVALETHAVRLAAERLTADDVADVGGLLDETREVLAAADDRAYPEELDFHQRIVALTGNQALLGATVEVLRQIHLARSRSGQQPRRARDAYDEHRAVVDHVAAGDGEAAARLMRAHLYRSLDNALRIFEG